MSADPAPTTETLTPEHVTIYEVAARAGVSIATVSHAMNRPERVSQTTRQRVLATAEQLGFVPKGRGRAVRSVKRIAVAAPFAAHPTYWDRFLGVLNAAEQVDVIAIEASTNTDVPALDRLQVRGPIDGAIIMGADPSPELAHELQQADVPIVLLDRPAEQFTSVTVNDEVGGAQVAEHLLAIGAKTFAWVSPAPTSSLPVTSGELRLRGFLQQLRSQGISSQVPWTICEDSFEGGKAAAGQIAASDELPDAVFALHDTIAAGLLTGFREAGIQVPRDIFIVGYDDIAAAGLLDLTTVRQPFNQSGVAAMDALRAVRANPEHPIQHISLLPELVQRMSTTRKEAASDE